MELLELLPVLTLGLLSKGWVQDLVCLTRIRNENKNQRIKVLIWSAWNTVSVWAGTLIFGSGTFEIVLFSVSDPNPDPHWIRIRWASGSGENQPQKKKN
jgi:hypothetical protein